MASNSIDIYNDIIDDKDDPIYDTASSESDEEDDENQRKFANLPEVQRQLECTIWFHPYLTRHQSESVLRTADEGVFLMRKRTHDEWGQYSLDVRSKMSVKHFPITLTEDGVILGSRLFPTVSSFMDHFRSTPVLTDESGTFVECRYPYPREVAEFEEYQEVTCHFIYGQDVPADRNDDSSRVGLSVGSKEGYMRKQGGIIKSWKTRWFELKGHTLCYYSNHKSKRPIRILPISKILNVIDDEQKLFKVVLPQRTFLMEAPTLQNKSEWLRILRWKMNELQKTEK